MSPVCRTPPGRNFRFEGCHCPQFAGRGVPSLWDGFLFLFFLLIAKFGAVPAVEISRWRLASVPMFGKANVRRHPFAVGSEPGFLALDNSDEAIVLELVVLTGNVVFAQAQLLGAHSRRHVNTVLQSRVVSNL
jgi:hypothetical protein